MKYLVSFALLTCFHVAFSQSYDHVPALRPVWARLEDLNGENGDVEPVEFLPDGRYIVSGMKYNNQVVL